MDSQEAELTVQRIFTDMDDVRVLIFMITQVGLAIMVFGVFAASVFRGDTIEPELAFVVGGIGNYFFDSARRQVTANPNGLHMRIEPDMAREVAK